MTEMIDRLMLPDGSSLTAVIWGKAGSGKSLAVEHWSKYALRSPKYDENWRLIYVSPKHEGFENMTVGNKVVSPIADVQEVVKSLRKNRLAIWFPSNLSVMDIELDYLIESLFDYQEANPDFSCTLILDDAQTWLEARKTASIGLKRIVLTGRSKRIKTVLLAHGLVISKILEGQTDLIIAFDGGNKIWWRAGQERYNLDLEKYAEDLRLKPYSYLWYDLRKNEPQLLNGRINPLELTQGRWHNGRSRKHRWRPCWHCDGWIWIHFGMGFDSAVHGYDSGRYHRNTSR
jgi:hypothetical protein